MKTSRGLKLLLLSTLIVMGAKAQSNVYEFSSITEKNIIKNKQHKSKGFYSVSISKDESRMTIYWDLDDLSERADFDLLNKRDTIIQKKKFILYTAASCAFSHYNISIFYPANSSVMREFNVIDKKANTYYYFNQ